MSLDPNRVKALFVAAIDLPPGERTAFIARECGADAALRARLDELLAAHDGSATVDAPPVTATHDPDATRTADAQPLGATGEVIGGRYHLIDEVGTGGMGSVWRAEQRTPVKRYVAVKLIKAGMDSKAVLARFDAERQALAVMDHPNIAKVLDGGVTADGRPYFVMELVKGTPITAFADARRLTPRQRLELFVPVCSAIQHAHMKGVIHRDIKPSNVLVALYDDKAVPKVIDFGVAKATGAALTDHTLHTGLGAVVGTPEYMSPEQASLNNLDIDTRSDVYSLGVLLYELLTGSPPFTRRELEKAGLLELLRVVREVEPQRPSAKLSTAAAKPSIAANRGTEPTALGKLLRSELDWLVMKALEKDRNRRYDSANGFAADVNRYLAGEAVQAVPPSLGYRVRKWVRKNRGLVTAAGLVAGTFAVGLTGTTWGLIRAEQEADRARGEEQKVRDEQTKTQAALDQAQLNLVHGYLRPIGVRTNNLDQAELIALDELARQEDHIKLLFLREVFTDGERALRIARRAERVTQAAVGTSLKRREQALKLTSEKQRDATADPRVRLCACWLAVELGSDDLPALSEVFDTLRAKKVDDWHSFTEHLPNKVSASNTATLADALVSGFDMVSAFDLPLEVNLLWALENALTVLAPRLDPATAKAKIIRVADIQVAALGGGADQDSLRAAANLLAALAPRLDPATVNRAGDALISALGRATDMNTAMAVASSLAALAPRLDPTVAARGFDAILPRVGTLPDVFAALDVVLALAALVPRLDPATARSGLARAADTVVRTISKGTDPSVLRGAANTLRYLAPHLEPAAAERGLDAVLTLVDKTTDEYAVESAGEALVALALRVDSAAARPKLARAADVLIGRFGKATGREVGSVGEALAALAPGLDPATAQRVNDAALAFLNKSTDPDELWYSADVLAALTPRLDPAIGSTGVETVLAILRKDADGKAIRAAGRALVALAPRLDPVAAGRGFEAVLTALGKRTNDHSRWEAAYALAVLAPRLDPTTVRQQVARAADTLLSLLERVKAGSASDSLPSEFGETLVILAAHLDPRTIGKLMDALAEWLTLSESHFTLSGTADTLAGLVPYLDRSRRAAWSAETLRLIAATLRTKPESHNRFSFDFLPDQIEEVRSLVDLLRDPGCVGEMQSAILVRLERLAYPEPAQAAVFAGLAADPLRAVTLPALQLADDHHRKQNRRFRTVSDAARWLAEHHPDLDLDKPYHKVPPVK